MYHAINCPEQIGWTNNTLKLLVLATESWFHYGGDGMVSYCIFSLQLILIPYLGKIGWFTRANSG